MSLEKPPIIDSHAHLARESFAEDQEAVIERALANNVQVIVQAGVDFKGIAENLALADRHPYIFNAVGLHPHEAKFWDAESADILRKAAKHTSAVGIGECGLDFYYDHSDRDAQRVAFRAQVRLARELGMPLVIHTRDAWEETFEILEEEGRGEVRGVFHCFTGGPEHLPRIEKLDFYVSFSGIITFKNATEIQAAAQLVRTDRFLVETDCPYLAPVPHRGKRNEPSFVWFVAEKIAVLRQIPSDEVARNAVENTRRLFALPPIAP